MGRAPKEINWTLVDELLEADCTGMEIAEEFHVHYNTLYHRVKERYDMDFSEYQSLKKGRGNNRIKLKQYRKAVDKGDTAMLLHLGKYRLNQKDADNLNPQKVVVNVNGSGLASGTVVSAETIPDTVNNSPE